MVAALRAAEATEQEIEERVVEIDLELYDSTTMDVAGIGVRAYRLKHSAYLIEDPRTGEMVDRHITRLVKREFGDPTFETIDDASATGAS